MMALPAISKEVYGWFVIILSLVIIRSREIWITYNSINSIDIIGKFLTEYHTSIAFSHTIEYMVSWCLLIRAMENIFHVIL